MKTMRLLLAVFIISAASLTASAQQSKQYSDSQYSVQYHVRNGLLNGKYVSFYSNGNKRAEGNFSDNNRTGKWIVYDSTGQKQVVRNYKSLFSYKRVFPKPYHKGPAKLLSEPVYEVQKNSDGSNKYFHLERRHVALSNRSWLFIDAEKNKLYFSADTLMSCLKTALQKDSATVYSNKDDEFRIPLTNTEALKMLNESARIAGFMIKQDEIFDNQRFLTESRIIGLCPLVKDNNGQYKALFWIYMPQFNKSIAQVKMQQSKLPRDIQTLEDVFFYRYFQASWVFSSSPYDRTFEGKLLLIDDNARYTDRFIIDQIETEHDCWVRFFGN
ncbi:hypothetical protein SDC9_41958 [bioreactor metagenome]|uniref:Uncharacterized protein n=1 Tax=bioreactor metagenome TaxID=1076179 RepID=A0A644VWV5_9ZZZZ